MKHKKTEDLKRSRLKNFAQKIKDASAVISAIIVLGGAFIGAGQWLVFQINDSTNSRIDELENKMNVVTQENKLAIMRLELMSLIQNDPDNVIEIEKYAREYFGAGGNRYMTGMISNWCAEHNVDCGTIILK